MYNSIKESVDYQRGYEHGWKECILQMTKELVKLENTSGTKPIIFQGFRIIEDSSITNGQIKMVNNSGEEIIINPPSNDKQ